MLGIEAQVLVFGSGSPHVTTRRKYYPQSVKKPFDRLEEIDLLQCLVPVSERMSRIYFQLCRLYDRGFFLYLDTQAPSYK